MQLFKKITTLFVFVFPISFLVALETNSSRIDKLEEEIEMLREDIAILREKQESPDANPGIMRDEWFVTIEPLYWYQRTNGTAFAYSNSTLVTTLPLKGRTKDIDFGWSWGLRAGAGRNIGFDRWDFFTYVTYYRNHVSGSTQSGGASILVPLRGSIVTHTGVTGAKSSYDLNFLTFDIELGRHYYVSEKLSFRPFIGLKNAWIDQAQAIRYTGGSIGRNSAHIDDSCDYWGLGARGGIGSKWYLSDGFYINGLFSGALLYGFFEIDHREKLTPSSIDRIKLEDNKHRFIPMVQWKLGLGWGSYFNQKENYLDIGLAYEGMYWWRINQMLKIYEYTSLRYDNFAEDLSMHGLTISARLYF